MQYHILIQGRVHGVFFRDLIENRAKKLNIKGWVKNVSEGVEVVAQGSKESLEKLLELCKKGPEYAEVENIKFKEEPEEEFTSFSRH